MSLPNEEEYDYLFKGIAIFCPYLNARSQLC